MTPSRRRLFRYAGGAALYTAVAYVIDVPIRRALAARRARAYANARGLPLLNVGAGTGRSAWFGETLYGDVNVDLFGRKDVAHGTPGVVTYANTHNLTDFKTGQFGAVLASHVLEHLESPLTALKEWRRVTGNDPGALFIVTPSWWAPHTLLHPGHLWYFADGAGCVANTCRPVQLRSEVGPTATALSLRGWQL